MIWRIWRRTSRRCRRWRTDVSRRPLFFPVRFFFFFFFLNDCFFWSLCYYL
ncbi:LOW QUALITY PROTEIN: hypothetical protein PanWU01x14_329220 [Parasponia andersonii]|uniref:Uncharacterized protein n=1 Tax=Parasponia andersonii TaxID=3476 RepID=A0A2P5AIH1_PARAD|nr:LOW QUALITY PROTEIN: hypothetical protein PanWU01x14_329220 [Parasponia andersonii]